MSRHSPIPRASGRRVRPRGRSWRSTCSRGPPAPHEYPTRQRPGAPRTRCRPSEGLSPSAHPPGGGGGVAVTGRSAFPLRVRRVLGRGGGGGPPVAPAAAGYGDPADSSVGSKVGAAADAGIRQPAVLSERFGRERHHKNSGYDPARPDESPPGQVRVPRIRRTGPAILSAHHSLPLTRLINANIRSLWRGAFEPVGSHHT